MNHEHILKTDYDNIQHWNECVICHEKKAVTNHSITTTWALGYESCRYNNSYTKVCNCGYIEKGHKPCVWDGKSYGAYNGFINFDNDYNMIVEEYSWIHTRLCKVCNTNIVWSYYMNSYNSGELYQIELGKNGNYGNYCSKANGSRITCNNLGTCTVCSNGRVAHNFAIFNLQTNKLTCVGCNQDFGTFTYNITRDNNTPHTYSVIFNINLYNALTSFNKSGFSPDIQNLFESNVQETGNISSDKKCFTLTTTGKLKSSIKDKIAITTIECNINGIRCRSLPFNIYADSIKPVITEISSEGNLTEWSKTKPIVIKGTENYCNSVNIKIVEVDNEENVIFNGGANVVNQKFEVSCIPELEASTQGKKYKVIVTDTCENSIEQEFEIAKVDSISPKITSNGCIEDVWAKEKIFTATATDTGIGEVQIAFNDESKYESTTKNDTEYSRTYKLIGDVYSPKQAIILYKDGLGNVSSKEVTIDKIDNTAPTITKASLHNNLLSITSNDICEGIGGGSGITQYKYAISSTQLNNLEQSNLLFKDVSDIQKDTNENDSFLIENIVTAKYIYIQAIDLVGNISDTFEFEVPQLTLTSSIDLSLSNNKGGIVLDWSGYDISDKYFVVYRKEKNLVDWEIIVNLEDKLNDSHFTDILSNDVIAPNISDINIIKNDSNNDININPVASDNGSKYSYYIECYSAKENTLISISNIVN